MFPISCEFTRACKASLMYFDDAKITNREPKPSHLPYCALLFCFIVRIGVFPNFLPKKLKNTDSFKH